METEETKREETIFSVKTEAFEGPLELLLELIEKRKLLINDISLAAVTNEYIQRVAHMEQNPLRETTQFVYLASTLLLIKSRSLLPVFDLTKEEEENIEDLHDRLRLYRIYRNAGKIIAAVFGAHVLYERQFIPLNSPIFLPDRLVRVETLKNAVFDVVSTLPKLVRKPDVQVKKTVSIEDMIERLRQRTLRQLKFGFRDFTGNDRERATVIVGFLALLEMVKQGILIVRQETRYDDIEIEREAGTTPRYI